MSYKLNRLKEKHEYKQYYMIANGGEMQASEEQGKPPSLFCPVTEQIKSNPQKTLKLFWKNRQVKIALELYDDCVFLRSYNEVSYINFDADILFGFQLSKLQLWFENRENKRVENFVGQNLEELQNFIEGLKNKCSQQSFSQKYNLIEQIGKSKNCEIWKVQRKIDSQLFAAKMLINSSKVQQEINILKQLKHPNLIYLHEYFIEPDSTVYILMDYQDGSLLDRMNQQEISYKQKLKLVIDMLNALEYLRIKGIVHRDIKPENILYSKKNGNFKIADFGIALRVGTIIPKMSGTPGYMAPELLQQDTDIQANVKSDIYSLGLTFYQIFTKKQYYSGSDNDQILENNFKAVSFRKKSYPSDDPLKLQKKLLQKMIRKKPEDRKNSLQIMKSSIYSKINLSHGKQQIMSSPHKSSSSEEDKFMDTVKKLFKIKSRS